MKKLALLSIIVNLLLPTSLAFAQPENTNTSNNDQTSETCTFPSTGQKVVIKDQTQTTIQFANCQAQSEAFQAIQNNTSPSNIACENYIQDSQEYQKILNKENNTEELKVADEIITKCEITIDELTQIQLQQADNFQRLSNYIDPTKNISCVTNDPNIQQANVTCEQAITSTNQVTEEQIQALELLDNIFKNNFVYQLIDPISNEDLVIQQRTCTYEYLRNKDGLLQVAGTEGNNTTLQERQNSNFYEEKSFIITEKQCFITYVAQCQPKLILDATIKFDEDLPISNYCKTYQVIYGTSGTDFIKRFVNIIYNLAVGIVGVIAVIVIIVNGIRISTAGDDSGVISDAKERIAQSLFGLAVLFLAWIILRSINPNFFSSNVEIQNPNEQTQEETTNNQP